MAVERKVIQTDGAEEFEPFNDLAADAVGNEGLARGEIQLAGRRKRAVERQGGEVGDGEPVDLDCERLWTEALASAHGTGRCRHETHHVFAVAVAAGLVDGVAEVAEDAVEAGARALALGWSVDEDVLLPGRQVLEWFLEVDAVTGCSQVD